MVAESWLRLIQEQLHEVGKPICEKYDLPPSVLRLKGIRYEAATAAPALPAIGDPTTITEFLTAIVVIVSGAIAAATVISATLTGGMALVAILVAIMAAGGVDNYARTGDMPLWFRERVLSLEKIDEVCKEKRPVVKEKLTELLKKDAGFKGQFTNNIVATLKQSLNVRINEARLLIS
jgi:hypothetical protein